MTANAFALTSSLRTLGAVHKILSLSQEYKGYSFHQPLPTQILKKKRCLILNSTLFDSELALIIFCTIVIMMIFMDGPKPMRHLRESIN